MISRWLATADGEVWELGENPDSHGKHIIVKHGRYMTRYNHLSAFAITKGERVKQGQVIGAVGSSGRSTGPHLHYEAIKDGENINPINFIKDYQIKLGDRC